MVLGVHDLGFSSQTIPVDQVFNLPDDGSFPPKSDLSLLRLSVPARLSKSLLLVLGTTLKGSCAEGLSVCLQRPASPRSASPRRTRS